jgi:hypothetical protein
VKAIAVLAVAVLITASCGSEPEPAAVTAPDSTAPTSPTSTVSASTSPMTSGSPSSTTIIEVAQLVPGIECNRDLDAFIDAQFAFVGTVSDVRGEILPWDVDAENPDRPQNPEPTRWVSFDVDGWFTVDWGTEFSVWMPIHDAAVGDRLAVGGDARYVSVDGFSGQSGEVEFCTPAADPLSESLAAWNAFFGPPIEAGVAMPEGEPDPQDLTAIDEAESAWNDVAGDSYSYLFSMYDRNDRAPCGSPTVRVVATPAGVDATSIESPRFSCESEVGSVTTIAELFVLARQVAGATEFEFRSNLDSGIVMSLYASDRSVEVQVNVRRFSQSTAPTVVGWDAVVDAANAAVETWVSTPGDRTTSIQIGGGERAHYDLTTTEVDGQVTEVRNGADPIDPASLDQPWSPYTVDGVFELIEELAGEGHVVAVFDPETGVPTDLYFDPLPEAIDDELSLQVAVAGTGDIGPSGAVSDSEQALRGAGADIAEFPGNLSDPRLADLCGVEVVTFDSDSSGLDEIIGCLSERAEAGGGSAAVFTTYTVEGDPIVSLWLVDADRASVYIDSSQDAFAGGPFAWGQLECDVKLPLPAPAAQFPDPYSTFDC